ncbi:acyltransferase family protein [Propioniciclava sp.]|uniref:acyltransferase family protein n=1 Tax=Propioniciclava sp. TaxID=2038686 RepID=UPI002601F2C5|nr:acyltransferase family protein [Propioniciclava sp.]
MTTTPAPGRRRNHVIDVARAASVAVVVIFHGLLYQVRIVDGAPAIIPWAAPTYLYPLTWVLMIMPLFFVAGGFGHALTLDRMTREGASLGHFLASRGRRLVGPLLVFVGFCTFEASAAAWAGHVDAAVTLSRQLMQLLWFVSVYLVIIAVAPLMVRLHDRHGALPMAVLLAGAVVVDAWSFSVGSDFGRNLNMLLVWPFVHQLGIAYERGWFRRGPLWTPWLALAGGAGATAALVFGAGYPPTSVGFADLPIANIQPPTLAMATLALAQCGLLGLVERSGVLAHLTPRVERNLAVANALMVTTYLWHIFCIGLAGLALVGLVYLWPAASGVLLNQLVVAACGLATVVALVPLIGRLEFRLIPPLGAQQDTRTAVAAFALLMAGTTGVWLSGTVLHPAAPASVLALASLFGGAWLMRRAADTRRRPGPVAE